MSEFHYVLDGKIVGEIPEDRVTVERTDAGVRYIVTDCLTAHGPTETCVLCDDGSSKDFRVVPKL